jgi:hypothetical protein
MDESWARARSVAAKQRWLLTAEQAWWSGLSPGQVSWRLTSGEWLALMRGVYLLDADMYDGLPVATWWRAALLAHGKDACLVGRSAARAHGAQGLPWDEHEVDLAVVGGEPRSARWLDLPGRPVDGPLVVVRQWPVQADEVVMLDDIRARAVGPSTVDAALLLDRAHAVCLFDWSLGSGVLDEQALDRLVAGAKRRPGVVHVRSAAALADGRAASPLESRVRLACVDGDLPPDDLQYEVRDSWGRVVAIGDLSWHKKRRRPLIAEADGRDPHEKPAAVLHDRRRGNALVIQCCDTVRFTWSDALRPVYIQQVVRAALAA